MRIDDATTLEVSDNVQAVSGDGVVTEVGATKVEARSDAFRVNNGSLEVT